MAHKTSKRLTMVTCTNCNTSFAVDLEKIPSGKGKAKCKKCGNLIIINTNKPSIKSKHSPEPPNTRAHSKPQSSVEHIELSTCPKCNHKQAKSEECEECGIIYKGYLSSRTKAFNQTIQTIGKKGLRYRSEEFEKLISRFPGTKTICDNYSTTINQALMDYSKRNYKQSRKTFTALLEEQPNLNDSIKPILSMLKLKEEKDATEKQTVNARVANCKACGKEVSKTAPACPHCGEQALDAQIKCPKCNSTNIALGKDSIAGTIAVGPTMLLYGMVGQNKPMRVCLHCKHEW